MLKVIFHCFVYFSEPRKIVEALVNIFLVSAGEDEIFEGVRKSEIVEEYLERIANQIETEDELVEKKNMIEKIIDRLIYHVRSFGN